MATAAPLPPFPWPKPPAQGVPARYAKLRCGPAASRVRLVSGDDVWVVASYESVRQVLRDSRFSSEHSHPGFPRIFPLGQQRNAHGQPPRLTYSGMDGAEHRFHRAMVADLFSARQMAAIEPSIRTLARDAIKAMLDGPRPADLISAVAAPVASGAISALLGIPPNERARFQQISAMVLGGAAVTHDQAAAAAVEFKATLATLLAGKHRHGSTDLLGMLAARYAAMGRYDPDQIVPFAAAFITAGHETMVAMIALGAAVLLDQGAHSIAGRGAMGRAIEELLRFLSVADLVTARVALEDVDLAGTTIRAGEGVIALGGGANHDPQRFPQPARFDPDRGATGHVAFGDGPHKCLGQHLARIELRAVFETLFECAPTLALAVPLDALISARGIIHGVEEVPVTWR